LSNLKTSRSRSVLDRAYASLRQRLSANVSLRSTRNDKCTINSARVLSVLGYVLRTGYANVPQTPLPTTEWLPNLQFFGNFKAEH
ncbi:MAG: hypothetical protein AAF316_14905, partial [Cyanobacteria bacterium P01_A01_bin.80]